MRVRCNVPGCGGIIDSPTPAITPCPECVKRFDVVPRLQEQIRTLQAQVLQLQAARLNKRVLPLLALLGKKPAIATEIATTLKRSRTNISSALLHLEKRGLVTVGEYRRVNGRAHGWAVWKLSPLGEKVVEAKTNGAAA